jgi:hypothetical protein
MRVERDRKRARKQARKRKLKYLRQRLANAKTPEEERRLIEKIRQVSPRAPLPTGGDL